MGRAGMSKLKLQITNDLDKIAPHLSRAGEEGRLTRDEFRRFWETDRTMIASCGFHTAQIAIGFVNIQQKVISYPSLDRTTSGR